MQDHVLCVHTHKKMDTSAGQTQWPMQFSVHLDWDKGKKQAPLYAAAEGIVCMVLADLQAPIARFQKRIEVMHNGDAKKVVMIYNTAENIWVRERWEDSIQHFWSFFSRGFGEWGRHLSNSSKKAMFLWVKRKDRKGFISALSTLKACLMPFC